MTEYRILEKLGKYRVQYKSKHWFLKMFGWQTLSIYPYNEAEWSSKEDAQKWIDQDILNDTTKWKEVK